jgi:hypothetical protein
LSRPAGAIGRDGAHCEIIGLVHELDVEPVPDDRRQRRVLLFAGLIFLVSAVAAGVLVLRNLSFHWPASHGAKRATAEMTILRSDPGWSSAPPGAIVTDHGGYDYCLDPSFDARPPTIWRDYRFIGSAADWFGYFNRTLPQRGWTRADDFNSGGQRVLNFTRHYQTFDAELIISQGEVSGEITSPNFC